HHGGQRLDGGGDRRLGRRARLCARGDRDGVGAGRARGLPLGGEGPGGGRGRFVARRRRNRVKGTPSGTTPSASPTVIRPRGRADHTGPLQRASVLVCVTRKTGLPVHTFDGRELEGHDRFG